VWWRRSDGTLARDVDVTRRAMPLFMRGRNESAVLFEYDLSLQKADAFVRAWNEAHPMLRIDVFHLCVWAVRDIMARYPGVNRFVAGGRLYQRQGTWFSYAVKRKLESGAPLAVVKRRFDTDRSFAEMVRGMQDDQAKVTTGRAAVEGELGLLLKFPGFVRRIIMACIRGLDRLGMLPPSYIRNDPMYASAFFANMASFGMPAVYHHLYEYGTAGLFVSIGRPVTERGSPTSGPDRRRVMTMKFTYDERMDDGLTGWFALRRIREVVEDPVGSGLDVLDGTDVAAPEPAPAVAPVDS
jgi:hypothetical protein